MSYYKGNETGMAIGLLPEPYYWWLAGAMFGQMVEYWYYTGDDTYNDIVQQALLAQVGPDNDYMPPNQTKTEGNDDQAFWGFAVLSAAELKFPDPPPEEPSWLALAQAIFNLQASRWDDGTCGGGHRWQIFTFNKGYDYKNTISNGGFFQLAARLARYTGNETYAQWAEKSYDWILTTQLFTDDYVIYDGAQVEQNCSTVSKIQWTYNIGVYLMGAANMYNYTNGDPKWRTRVEGLLNGSLTFFPAQYGSNIMVETACEPQQTCNHDQPSFKAYLSRWMTATVQLAPFTASFINPKLRDSAKGAAGQCSGGSNGVTCGRTWHSSTWDGKYGVGEQMSALSIIQGNLVSKVSSPATADKGGTSKGNPSAGSSGDNPQQASNPTGKITTGDRAGAGILTALILGSLPATSSYNKRRKLSPVKSPSSSTNTEQSLPSSSDLASLGQSSAQTLRDTPRQNPPLPPHLRNPNRRSPTPEPSHTRSSSPSGAYAGLNIDSDGSVYASGQDGQGRRAGSLVQAGLGISADNPGRSYRAASPAKRLASAMNHDGDATMAGQAERDGRMARAGGDLPSESITLQGGSMRQTPSHRRGSSPDMQNRVPSTAALQKPQNGATSIGSSSVEGAPAHDIPSIDDQIRQVMSLVQREWMQEGIRGYVVACKWLCRVLSRGSDAARSEKYGKEAKQGPIGPVDNASIWLDTDAALKYEDEKGEAYVFMKPYLVMSEDYEVLPQAAWDLIIGWYGKAEGSPIITRYCHNTSTSDVQENLQFEIYPPIFTILKLPDTSQGLQQKDLKERDLTPVRILASRHERYQTFLKRAKVRAGVELKTKVRVWRILGGLGSTSQDGMLTPAQSRSNSPSPGAVIAVDAGNRLVIDVNTFAQLQLGSQRELMEAKDETANPNYNGRSTIDFVGLRQDGVIVLEEMIGGPAGGEWVSDASTAMAKTNGVPVSVTKRGNTVVKDSLKPSAASSRGTSPAPGGVMTRGRQAKTGRSRGTVGLGNLGNTCYMNSALQCVRSVEELTVYFLEEKYKQELNPSNPLSHNGDVAKAYARLLHEMYDPKQVSSFTPRGFKNTIGKYGPSFSGYQQQDSQEFLLFLLDGLQEDLNRIHQKPYIEKPDSTDEMVNDPAALREMADKCWEIYKKRNDSVITDLFAGMYKSTVVCPVCDKVSIIFDPFNNLTLQLPIQNIWSKSIRVYPLRSAPFEVAVDIDKNSSWSTLGEYVAKKLGLDSKKLIIAEIWQHKLYKIFDLKKSINEDNIADSDQIGCFELEEQPTNYPPPKKPKRTFTLSVADDEQIIPEGDSPMADRMLVSLFHRRIKSSSSRFRTREFFGDPSLMIITREEARDFDAIFRKCLSRVETMTTRNFLREDDAGVSTEDSDTVLLNADDSSDGRIQAESLESEDGMVDISVDNDAGQPATSRKDDHHLPGFTRKPFSSMLKPGSFITPGTKRLFEMKTYSPGNEMVPLGFQCFMSDADKNLPSIASRTTAREEAQSKSVSGGESCKQRLVPSDETPPTSDEEDEGLPPHVPQMQPALDEGDESDGLPEVEQIIQPAVPAAVGGYRASGSHRDSRGLITYGKKDKRKAKAVGTRERNADREISPYTADQPLLQLGECIVLDWTEEGYDALFSGSVATEEDGLPSRGMPTWEDLPVQPDPELEEKRKTRNNRKKTGFNLGDCLDEFGKPEILSANDAWYCPRCKEHRRASKTFELWKAPDILVIHLKRFSAQGRFNNKLDVMVDFPLEGLDLSSRLATKHEDGMSPVYELFAVDNHYGGLGGGHYTAYAKNFIDKNWYEYNDSWVTRRKDESVITSAAYLLFYRRVSSMPLGGPFFEQLMSAADIETPSASQPNSRAASPSAGEGKRLDDSPRNGSSSALREVGAAHQAGGGGRSGRTAQRQMGVTDDEPPPYSTIYPKDMQTETLGGMDLDEDEGIGMEDSDRTDMRGGRAYGPFNQPHREEPAWSFDNLNSDSNNDLSAPILHLPPPNSDVDADDDRDSVKVGSATSDPDHRMADFADDEGTTMIPFETPPGDMEPSMVQPWQLSNWKRGADEEAKVLEVKVSPPREEEHDVKMD
ncbi:MAG: hypothetical protein Q9163_002435 [Psora crenata]